MGKRVNGKLIWAIFLLLWVVLVRFLTGCSVENCGSTGKDTCCGEGESG